MDTSARLAAFLFLLVMVPSMAYGQTTVSGTVTDTTRDAGITGANVVLKGTTVGTVTDDEGRYSLQVPSVQDTLVFSFVGYRTKEVPIDGRTEIDVVLSPATVQAGEVVVVAFGEQDRELVTSSVSSVDGQDLAEVPVASVGNSLYGKVPGLQAEQTTGLPGNSGPEIFVRGIGSLDPGSANPIYVVDGNIVPGSVFAQLDPNNIESVSVLKDAASTAVYGIRGANGVIEIETKRGSGAQPMQITVRSSIGMQQPTTEQEFVGSYEYAQGYHEAQRNDGVPESQFRFSDEAMNAFRTGSYPTVYPNTDWVDFLTQDAALQTQTNINVSGGTQDVQYFISGGFLRQNGFLKDFSDRAPDARQFNPSFTRYNLRSNLDIDVTPTTEVALSAFGRVGTRIRSNAGSWWRIYSSVPFSGTGITDGKFVTTNRRYIPGRQSNVTPRLFGSGFEKNITNTANLSLTGTQQLDFITEGLEIQLKGSYNSYFTQFKDRSSTYPRYQPFFKTDADPTVPESDSSIVYRKIGRSGILGYSESYSRDRDWYAEGRLEYQRGFGGHNFKGLLLYSQSKDFYPGSFTDIPRKLVSTVGRINYNYEGRYLAEFSMGYNGSENFAEGQRFGFFPAGSVGWIVSKESFMEDVEFLDFLKLRASYGITGSDTGIGRFLYLPAQYNRDAAGYNFGYDVPQNKEGASEGALGNPGVTWETATKQDYGIDVRAFDNQLDVSVTYFHEMRNDILTTLNTVPDYVAADFPAVNVGRVENQGYEAQLTWSQDLGDFRYSIGGNVTYTHNKVLEQSEPARNEPYQRRTGQPVGQQYGYVFDGYYTEEEVEMIGSGVADPAWPVKEGYLKFKDLNGDGVINADDQRAVGYSEHYPEYSIGSNMSFGYKNLGLSMTWSAATNFSEQIQFSPYQNPFGGGRNFSIMEWQWEGRWTEEKAENGENIEYPRFTLADFQQRNNKNADFWMADASYLRLKNIQLSYSLNEGFLRGLGAGLEEAMFYVSGYNLLTFSPMMDKYTIDPEQNALNFEAQYPVMKTYRFGVELKF